MNHDKAHILVIDDDDRLRALLGKYLSEHGFLVTVAADTAEARRKMAGFIFDLLILDVMMPDETGIEFLISLGVGRPPTLMLSAMGEAEDRVKGLEVGAEDYLTKPFEPKELLLRIQAILRRTMVIEEKSSPQQIVQFGDFRFDPATTQLKKGEEAVSLTSGEAAILKLLAENAGSPVSREDISKAMPSATSERSIDVQMSRLRKKLQDNDSKPIHLQTVRGAGYVLYAKAVAATNGGRA